MQRILCFGDSNTWGFGPDGTRIEPAWPAIMAKELAILELTIDARPGRTAVSEACSLGLTPGLTALKAHGQADYDWLLLMLGTNELARGFHLSAEQAAAHVASLADWALAHQVCRQVLLMAPPPLGILSPAWKPYFDGRQPASRRLTQALATQAETLGCRFVDTGQWTQPAEPDGLHLDAAGQRRLGEKMARLMSTLSL